MVIGNGLIANAFKKYKKSKDVIIFASGVSNSKEVDTSEFEREKKKLKSYKGKGRLVYFSTCSLSDESLYNSPYVLHKRGMENYILENFDDNIIFRLPIIVGNSKNPNTFFNYFKDRISKGLDLTIDKDATRYILDADDLHEMLSDLIDNGPSSKIINVSLNNKTLVSDLIDIMEEILDNSVKRKYKEGGSSYDIDNRFFIDFLSMSGASGKFLNSDNYNYELLKKYL